MRYTSWLKLSWFCIFSKLNNAVLVIYLGCETLQGYQGLVDGGDNIKLANWHSVTNIIQQVFQNIIISHF